MNQHCLVIIAVQLSDYRSTPYRHSTQCNALSANKDGYKSRHGNPIVKNFININLFVSFQNLFGFSVASVVGEVCVCLLRADTPLAPRYKSPVHATAILIVEAMPISIYFLWSVCGYVDVEIPRNLLVSDFFFQYQEFTWELEIIHGRYRH